MCAVSSRSQCVGRAVSFARWAAIRRDMLCIPKANHKKLVDDCYPTSKALVNAAPEYRPNANELGRLVYYAQCKPAKLSKVGRLLMTRASSESRAFMAANTEKNKALVMITLGVLRDLVSSCQEGHAYLAPAVRSMLTDAVNVAAPTGSAMTSWDMDICARASSIFAMYVQSIPAGEVDTDDAVSSAVFQGLSDLQRLGKGHASDQSRMIWIAGINGLIRSPVLMTPLFPRFLPLILPIVLDTLSPAHIPLSQTATLSQEIDNDPTQSLNSMSHSSAEQSTRAALKMLWSILHRCDATQLRALLTQTLAYLDGECLRPSTWEDNEWPLWILAVLIQWSLPSSRYVVPHCLVNALTTPKKMSNIRETRLLQALHVILESKTDIVGLNMTELLDGHVFFLLSRVQNDPYDATTVQATIDAICHLANYTVYSDQLDDFVQQIAPHILNVLYDTQLADESKKFSICALLSCLEALFRSHPNAHVPLRTWASTEAILTSRNSTVRVAYLHTLLVHLRIEQALLEQGHTTYEPVNECIGFLHALAARMYTLATLGLVDDAATPTSDATPSFSATPADYAMMHDMLDTLLIVAPAASLLAFVPPWLSMAQVSNSPGALEPVVVNQTLAIRWLVGATLAQISLVWQIQPILDYVRVYQLPSIGRAVPEAPTLPDKYHPLNDMPPFKHAAFAAASENEWDLPLIIEHLSLQVELQTSTHADAPSLRAWFSRPWSVPATAADARTAAQPTITRSSTFTKAFRSASPLTRENSMDVRKLRMALMNHSSNAGTIPASLMHEKSSPIPSTPMHRRHHSRSIHTHEAQQSVSDVLDRYTSKASRRAPLSPNVAAGSGSPREKVPLQTAAATTAAPAHGLAPTIAEREAAQWLAAQGNTGQTLVVSQ